MSLGYVRASGGNAMMPETYAQALAAFVGRCRPDWDHPGILAAIRKAGDLGAPAAVGAALCRLAENHEIRTPALLAEPGRHWQGTTVASRIPPSMCPTEGHGDERAFDCRKCAAVVEPMPEGFRELVTAAREASADDD